MKFRPKSKIRQPEDFCAEVGADDGPSHRFDPRCQCCAPGSFRIMSRSQFAAEMARGRSSTSRVVNTASINAAAASSSGPFLDLENTRGSGAAGPSASSSSSSSSSFTSNARPLAEAPVPEQGETASAASSSSRPMDVVSGTSDLAAMANMGTMESGEGEGATSSSSNPPPGGGRRGAGFDINNAGDQMRLEQELMTMGLIAPAAANTPPESLSLLGAGSGASGEYSGEIVPIPRADKKIFGPRMRYHSFRGPKRGPTLISSGSAHPSCCCVFHDWDPAPLHPISGRHHKHGRRSRVLLPPAAQRSTATAPDVKRRELWLGSPRLCDRSGADQWVVARTWGRSTPHEASSCSRLEPTRPPSRATTWPRARCRTRGRTSQQPSSQVLPLFLGVFCPDCLCTI